MFRARPKTVQLSFFPAADEAKCNMTALRRDLARYVAWHACNCTAPAASNVTSYRSLCVCTSKNWSFVTSRVICPRSSIRSCFSLKHIHRYKLLRSIGCKRSLSNSEPDCHPAVSSQCLVVYYPPLGIKVSSW